MGQNINNSQITQVKINSAASTNATLVKAGLTSLVGVLSIMNASAATKYVRLYDKATLPTVGTDAPIVVIAVPATSSKELVITDNGDGVFFPLGLGLAITGGAARLDSTAVAAGDVQLYMNVL